MSKKISGLIVCLALLFAVQRPSLAANQVITMDIQAVIYEDGSMHITQSWEGRFEEGTEIYIPMNAPDYLAISELTVSDLDGSYDTVPDWNINWSFEEKARKCGIHPTDSGYEICFGITEYGQNRYAIEYKLSNVVGSYGDKDGVNFRFVNDGMNTTPTDVKVEIRLADGTPITDETADAWGFGFQGEVEFADGGILAYTNTPLTAENHVTVLFSLDKGILYPSRQEPGSFEDVREKAFEGSDYDNMTDTANDTVTLYAQWATKTHTVTFDSNKGSGSSIPTTAPNTHVPHGGTYGTLPTVSRTGYTFDGWFTAASGGTMVASTGTVGADHALYARWTANSCTVTFDVNGGDAWTGGEGSGAVTFDAAYGILPTPTRTGYTFKGWYTAATGGTRVDSNAVVAATENHTIYAQWAIEATTTYQVWVAGIQVSNANMNDVLGDGGSVKYTPADGTNSQILTLTNANISASLAGSVGNFNAVISAPYGSGALTIHLVGNNTVTNNYNSGTPAVFIHGIYVHNVLTFTGDGTLTVSTEGTTAENNYAIHAGEGGSRPVINGPAVNAYAGAGSKSYGLLVHSADSYDYSITLASGTLNAKGHTAAVCAYGVKSGEIILSFTRAYTDYEGTSSGTDMVAGTDNCKLYKNISITNPAK